MESQPSSIINHSSSIKLNSTYPFYKEIFIPYDPSMPMKELVSLTASYNLIFNTIYFDFQLEKEG